MRHLALTVAVVALGGGTGLSAQGQRDSVIGSNIPSGPSPMKDDKAGPLRKEFARCVYRKRGAVVDNLLRHSDPMTVDYKAIGTTERGFGERLRMPDCLAESANVFTVASRMSRSRQNMRSLFLEEAYLARRSSSGDQPGQAAPRLYVSDADVLQKARGLGEYADCIVARDPGGADGLLHTVPGSVQEGQASHAFVTTLRDCLTNGQTVSFTPASIRGLVADGLWQRSVAGAVPLQAAVSTVGQR